jgi:hypothetical protein
MKNAVFCYVRNDASVPSFRIICTLKMEAAGSSELSVLKWHARRHIPVDGISTSYKLDRKYMSQYATELQSPLSITCVLGLLHEFCDF